MFMFFFSVCGLRLYVSECVFVCVHHTPAQNMTHFIMYCFI